MPLDGLPLELAPVEAPVEPAPEEAAPAEPVEPAPAEAVGPVPVVPAPPEAPLRARVESLVDACVRMNALAPAELPVEAVAPPPLPDPLALADCRQPVSVTSLPDCEPLDRVCPLCPLPLDPLPVAGGCCPDIPAASTTLSIVPKKNCCFMLPPCDLLATRHPRMASPGMVGVASDAAVRYRALTVPHHHLPGIHHVRDLPVHVPIYGWLFWNSGAFDCSCWDG